MARARYVVAMGLVVVLCAITVAASDTSIWADTCGADLKSSQSEVTRVVGMILEPYKVNDRQWHAGNLVRHSIWTALAIENWLTDTNAESTKERYWVSGLHHAPLEDKKMLTFTGLVHDIAKGGFPNCAYPVIDKEHHRYYYKSHDASFVREIGGNEGQSGTDYHPEVGARMIAGRVPFLVYESNTKPETFAYLKSQNWIRPLTTTDVHNVLRYHSSAWGKKSFCPRETLRNDLLDKSSNPRKDIYVFDVQKLIDVAGLSGRRHEISILTSMHWGFGRVNRLGLSPGVSEEYNPIWVADQALYFLNALERSIREAQVDSKATLSFSQMEKAKLSEWAVLISYADVKGQSIVPNEVEDPTVRLQLFDIPGCDRDPRKEDLDMFTKFGLETSEKTKGRETNGKIYPARRTYDLLMAICGARSVDSYLKSEDSSREDFRMFVEWSRIFGSFSLTSSAAVVTMGDDGPPTADNYFEGLAEAMSLL